MRPAVVACVLALYVAAGHTAVAEQAPTDEPDEEMHGVTTRAGSDEATDGPATRDEPEEGMYGPTTRDETLWSIARQVRPAGATLDGTVAALRRMNPDAFVLGDPDLLMKDVWLKVPTTVAETAIGAEELATPAAALSAWEDVVLEEEAIPEPAAADDTDRELLEIRNAELEADLEALRTDLAAATAKVETLEGQVSSLRRQLAESEARTPDWQSSVARIAETTRRNSDTVTALAVLLVVVLLIVYAGNRSKRWRAAEEAGKREEPTRVRTGQPMTEAVPGATDRAHDEYAPATKLNLARAFIDMGRADQAREVLEEVLAEGSEDDRREADELLRQMG